MFAAARTGLAPARRAAARRRASRTLAVAALALAPRASALSAAAAVAAVRGTSVRRYGAPTAAIYDAPALYDAAFGFRDFEDEVDFLVAAHERAVGSAPRRALELMAGPARHAIAAAARGMGAAAIDSSPAMAAYGTAAAAAAGVDVAYAVGDVTDGDACAGLGTFDTAWLLLGSAGYLLTADAAIDALRSVGGALADGGSLVLELPHPRETFRVDDVGLDAWTAYTPDGDEVRVAWGGDDDAFDPLTQIRDASVAFDVYRDGKKVSTLVDTIPTRVFTLQEILLIARLSGCFDVAATYGALDSAMIAADDDDLAFRLVVVLTKKPRGALR